MIGRRTVSLAVAAAALLGVAATAEASPAPAPALERIAASGTTPRAMAAERRLRAIERRVLGAGHAAEHAELRAAARRAAARAARRARLGLPPERPHRRARSLALGDPAQVGRWLAPQAEPVVAVHAIMLRTGRVMFIQQNAGAGVAYIWDPATNTGHRADPPANVWCGGQTFLADGRVLFVGGTLAWLGGLNYLGLNQLWIFDPVTETWSRQVDMRHGRWYPTATRLPDGRVLLGSGIDETGTDTLNPDVEIFTPDSGNGDVQLATSRTTQFYPHWFVMPDGRALLAGPGRSDSGFLNLSTWAFTANAQLAVSHVGYAPGLLLPGAPSGSTKVMVVSGGGTAATETFDAAKPGAGWVAGPPLPQIRRNLNAVILPDGALLAVGGNMTAEEGEPQRESLMLAPGATSWTPMAAQSEQRGYHSTALLLPDGRVWSGGDNTASGGGNSGDMVEIYDPPYLHRGPRPSITTAPTSLGYGQAFSIAAGGAPVRAVLMSPGATTHGNDMNQRHVELAVTATPGGLDAVSPPSVNVAPPGWYMLFVLDADGVPSTARWVRVGAAVQPPPTPPNRPPTAAFTAGRPATGRPITLTDASTDADGRVTAVAWDTDNDGQFDDGTGAIQVVTFATPGTSTVRLRATDDEGASAIAARQLVISDDPPPNRPPAAAFTVSANPTVGRPVVVTDTSTDPDGTIAARAWDTDDDGAYDDGTGVTAQAFFETGGDHVVRLRVTDDMGDSATSALSFTVADPSASPAAPPAAQPALTPRAVTPAALRLATVRLTVTGRSLRVRVRASRTAGVLVELRRCTGRTCALVARRRATASGTATFRLPSRRAGLRVVVVATAADGGHVRRMLAVR